MSSMDLDDLDGPIQAPTKKKPSRFLSKSSNLKPEPKPEPQELDDAPVFNKKEEVEEDRKPVISAADGDANGVAKMEVEVEEPKDDPMNVDDGRVEEDYVVREIDVYFTPAVDDNTQLYLMQYPLRPCWRPYELDERCEEVRVKPKSVEVEVDLSVDVHSNNFDPKWANDLVNNMRKDKTYDRRYDGDWASNVKLDKQTLSSSWKPPCSTGYAIGILMGNKLHLNPIHAVLQLRPSMEHLKAGGSIGNNDAKSNVDFTVKSEEFDEQEPITSSKKQSKLMGHLNEQDTTPKECWVPLKYHSSKSDYSARYIQKLVAEESSPIHFSMSPYDYVNSLCPGASNNITSKGPSKRFLLSLPLEERLKKWLFEGDTQVHRFNSLKHLAPDVTDKDFLRILQQYAILVQGLWVAKSEFLFREVEGNLRLFRDHILFKFSERQNISYIEINKLKNALKDRKIVPNKKTDFIAVLNRFLHLFAVDRPRLEDWKFKEPTDGSFIELHPEIVEEQKKVWEEVGKKTTNFIFGHDIKKPTNSSVAYRAGTSISSDKGAAVVANGDTGRMRMSAETREALPKALEVLFKSHTVCSFQMICEGLRDLAVSTSTVPKADPRMFVVAAKGAEAPIDELKAVISEVAISIHGVYVSKSSSQYPEYNQLRQVVINLLCARGPNAKLKKAEIYEAAKIALGREIASNEYIKVVTELCESQKSGWVLKSGDGKPK